MSDTPTMTRANWARMFDEFPGTLEELARKMGVTRMTLWTLRRMGHDDTPWHLLRKLRTAFVRSGAPCPTLVDLGRQWREAKAEGGGT